MKLITDFDKLSFHDSSIHKIIRNDGQIHIYFEKAYIEKSHPKSQEKEWCVLSGILHLFNVSGEEAKYWRDTKAGVPCNPLPLPLDEIMEASFDGSKFYFSGFRNREPWFEWFVMATGFEFEAIKLNDNS